MSQQNPDDYTIGWICALTCEFVAAQEFLDEEHDQLESQAPNDTNSYALGTICRHKVVIACLPDGEYGISSATDVLRNMLRTFTNVRVGLMVGVGGGAPTIHDIRLGDVVVGTPGEGLGGVFQYDFGRDIQNEGFQATILQNRPPDSLLTALNMLKARYERKGNTLERAVAKVLDNNPRLRRNYSRPESATDVLFEADFTHIGGSCVNVCATENPAKVKQRSARAKDEDDPQVHYGLIASANKLMKNAEIRDSLAITSLYVIWWASCRDVLVSHGEEDLRDSVRSAPPREPIAQLRVSWVSQVSAAGAPPKAG